jgi:hypothetical protein
VGTKKTQAVLARRRDAMDIASASVTKDPGSNPARV